jgi:hypothetical protein
MWQRAGQMASVNSRRGRIVIPFLSLFCRRFERKALLIPPLNGQKTESSLANPPARLISG